MLLNLHFNTYIFRFVISIEYVFLNMSDVKRYGLGLAQINSVANGV